MDNHLFTPVRFTVRSLWFRLGMPVLLAFVLMAALLSIPIIAASGQHVSVISSSPSAWLNTAAVQAAGSISITKSAVPSETVNQGFWITYTLVVTNNTGQDLNSLTVVDPVPPDTSCHPDDDGQIFDATDSSGGDWLGSQAGCSAGVATWVYLNITSTTPLGVINTNPGASFGSNEVVTLTFRVRVSQPLRNRVDVIDNSTYTVYSSNPNYVVTGTTAVTNLVFAPEWAITKTAVPSTTVRPGQRLTYTITVTNVGDHLTNGPYFITEVLPEHTNFVTASLPVTVSGNTLTWKRTGFGLLQTLAEGQSDSVYVFLTVTEQVTNTTQIINNDYSVTGGAVFTDGIGDPVTVTVDVPITLTVQKTAAATVQAGDLLTYTVTITNDATSLGDAFGLVFTDAVPVNTNYVDHGFGGSVTGTLATDGSVVTWTVASSNQLKIEQAVQLTLTVRTHSPLPNGTVITNSRYGPTLSNTLFVAPLVPITTVVNSAPIITLTKTVTPNLAVTGQPVTYTIVVTNTGNETAVNLPFTDAVQASDFTPTQATWALTVPGRDLKGNIGVVSYTLMVTTGLTPGNFPNFVTATVRGVPVTIGPVATVTVRSPVDLQVRKARLGNGDVVRGDAITYTLTITTPLGADPADALVTDVFSNASVLTYSVAYPDATCDESGGGVACTVPALAGPTVITVVLDTSKSISGIVTNTAVITTAIPGQGDPITTNNRSVVTTPVRYPIADLQISKVRLGSDELITGDLITYTLTITNASGSETVPAAVGDIFTNATYVSYDISSPVGTCQSLGHLFGCSLPAFTGTAVITLVLDTADSVSGTITNTAGITIASEFVAIERNPADNRVDPPVTTTVRYPIADLRLSKVRLGSVGVIAGDIITYTLTITNPSGADIVDAVVTDTFTGTVASISSNTTRGDICSDAGNPIVCNFKGFTGTETITVVLQAANSFSGTLTNTAHIAAVTANTIDDPLNNNSDTVTTTVRQLVVDLQIAKTGPALVAAGDQITYTVVITNIGPDTVDAIVTDTIFGTFDSVNSATPSSGSCGLVGSIGPVICTFDDFTGTAVITVVLTTSPSQLTATLTNIAVITTTNPNAIDLILPNRDSVTTTVRPRQADLQIEKALVGSSSVIAGNQVTFTLTITNAGPDAVEAALNEFVTPASAVTDLDITTPADWLCSGFTASSVTCSNSNFDLGTQTVTVVLTTSAAFSGTLNNNATIAVGTGAIEVPGKSGDNQSQASVDVNFLTAPVLTITKTASPDDGSPVLPGGTIRYTLAVTNMGTAIANTVVITDDLSGTAFVSGSGSTSGSSISESGGRVTVSAAALGTNKVLTATWEVTVTAATSGTTISNYANAASAGTPVITSNLVAHDVITVPPTPPVYLPLIIKNCCFANLVIESFSVDTGFNPPKVEVVVKNDGLGSTGEGFWVDLYVNPSPLPASLLNASNPGDRRWQRLKTNVDRGIGWEISTPLAPGESVTLTEISSQVNGAQTKWSSLPTGISLNFYTFADSFDADNNRYVEIDEGSDANELDNQDGPIIGTLSVAETTGTLESASPPAESPLPRHDLGH